MVNIIERVSNNIKYLKQKKNLNWNQLGPQWRSVEKMCSGKSVNGITIKVLDDAAKALGVKPGTLLNKDLG